MTAVAKVASEEDRPSERRMTFFEHIEELRAKNPQLSETFFRQMEQYWHAQYQLDALRSELHRLIGYHGRDGAVPIETIQAALDELRTAAAR